jgi:hypothetical protein
MNFMDGGDNARADPCFFCCNLCIYINLSAMYTNSLSKLGLVVSLHVI